MKKSLLSFLSKQPSQILVFLFVTLFFVSSVLSNVETELKVLVGLFYIPYLAWFISGKFKNIIQYIGSIITIVSVASVVSVSLEATTPNITAVFLPSVLFCFFGTQTSIEFLNNSYKYKILTTFINAFINIILTMLVFMNFPNLNTYFAVIISSVLVLIVTISFYVNKINNNKE